MASITSTQLLGLTDAVHDLYALGPSERFPARVLAAVQRVIGCDSASYNEIDLATAGTRVVVEPHELATPATIEAFAAHADEHPVVAHYAATGDGGARMISDFLRPCELHRLGLYADLFAPLGVEAQLSTTLPMMPRTRMLGVALNRGAPGFGEQERMLLDLLRSHLVAAYENSLRYTAALAAAGPDPVRAAEAAAVLDRLTDRQRDILGLVSRGDTNQQIAYELGISLGTVKKHLEHILERLDVRTRVAAAALLLVATPSVSCGPLDPAPEGIRRTPPSPARDDGPRSAPAPSTAGGGPGASISEEET